MSTTDMILRSPKDVAKKRAAKKKKAVRKAARKPAKNKPFPARRRKITGKPKASPNKPKVAPEPQAKPASPPRRFMDKKEYERIKKLLKIAFLARTNSDLPRPRCVPRNSSRN